MAVVNGDPSYFIDLADTGGPIGSFQVRDDSGGGGVTKFTVTNGGLVTVTNDIERSGTLVLGNTSGSTGDMASLEQDGTERLKFSWDGTRAVMESSHQVKLDAGGAITLEASGQIILDNASGANVDIVSFRSNGSERLKVEYDGTNAVIETGSALQVVGTSDVSLVFGDTTATTHTMTFVTRDGGGGGGTRRTLTTLTEAGIWKFGNDSGTLQAQLEPEDTNDDCHLDLGIGETRGKLSVYRDDGTPKRAGIVRLEPDLPTGGSFVYIYAWYDGGSLKLFADDTDPAGAGPSGAAVELASF